MTAISAYLGIFTGLLISLMGIYLYFQPIESDLPAWVKQGLPFFMIAYGAIRFSFSLYKILRRRDIPTSTLIVLLAIPLLTQCKSEPKANVRMKFDYMGDCSSCPISRMDSILRIFFPKGIISVTLDTTQHQVSIELDSNQVRLDSLRHVLLAYGYEIDEEIAIDPILSSCCTIPLPPAEGGGDADPLAGPSPSDIQEDMSLLERELEQELGVSPDVPQLNLDTELNLDEDLGLDELDLEGGGLTPADDLGLEDLDMELDLDLEESKPAQKKPSQAKP
ncbi:MAG: hypothetical protein RMJ57_02125 [Bacteroidia bacterium]|nr:hypothetical protein [Bacteroidia bacterium]